MRQLSDRQFKDVKPVFFMNKKYVMRIFRALLIGAVFISGFYNCGSASGGQETDILAVGEGAIKDNNMAEARKTAISDALKKGIGQYLSRYLGSQGMAVNFTALMNDIVPFAGEDIENYQILAEGRNGEIYSILVSIKVNEKLIEQRLKDAGITSIEYTPVKILFMVSEEKAAGKGSSYWWNNPEGATALTTAELMLYNIFQDQGMEPINRLSNVPSFTYSEDMRMLNISDEAAIKWGRIFSADVIIIGRCRAAADNTVAVDLEAFKVEEGRSIYRADRMEQMDPLDSGEDRFMNAIHRAINNIAVQFRPQIIKSFKNTEGESKKILITLMDVNNFEQFRDFKNFLEKEVGGIKSVVQSRIKGNSMTLSVEFFGERDSFITRLKGNKKFSVQAGTSEAEGVGLVITIENEMLDYMSDRNTLKE